MRARHVQALAALTVLAAILRFSTLHVQSYWFDEAVTVGLVKSSFGHMLSRIGGSESTPPLYYAIAWVWTRVFGDGEFGLRSLSALAGTAFIPVAYAAAAELASRRVALVVAGLATVNPLLIWYSQEARSYALLLLLGSLSFLLFARMLSAPRPRTLAAWTVVSALALATHYFAGFLILPEAVWLLLRWRDRRQPALAIVALIAVAGALLPLLLKQRRLDLASFISGQSLIGRVLRVPKQFAIGYSAPVDTVLAIAAACLLLLGLWLAYARTIGKERHAARVCLIVAGVGIGVPLVMALAGADYLDTRNVLAAWLPAMMLPALGFGARNTGRTGTLAALALGAIGLFVTIAVWVNPTYQRDDNRGLARALGPATVPRAIVVTPVYAPTTLRVYMSPFSLPGPARPLRVQEIDIAALPLRSAGVSGRQGPPRLQGAASVQGIPLVERRFARGYTLLRYRAPTPVLVTGPVLSSLKLDPRSAAVLYQP
ncbi:MAG: glycosyltransferase family 39 protein [Thermoleophilaceae bacterium]